MHTAPFLWMHIITLICNLLLYISYSSIKGDGTVDTFRGLLALYILCPLSSICQRMFLWPGPLFWFKVSQIVLMLLPASIYYFLIAYVGRKPSKKDHAVIWTLTGLLVIPSIFDVYLNRPILSDLPGNQIGITYESDWRIAIPFLIILAFFVICYRIMNSNKDIREFKYINIGIVSLIVGNILLVIPGNTFPYDMVGCLINAVMLAIALSRLNLLKFRIYLSFETLVFMAALTTGLSGIAIFEILAGDSFVAEYSKIVMELWVVSTVITLLISYLYAFASRRTSLVNSDHLLDTSRQYSEAMMADMDNQDQIISNLKHVLAVTIGEFDSIIYLYDKKNMCYSVVGKEKGNLNYPDFAEYSKLTSWLTQDQRVDSSNSMIWTLDKESEALKYEIYQRKLTYIVPFISDGELLGFMLFGTKSGRRLNANVIHAIESLVLTTSLALQTLEVYRQLKEELSQDSVTGLLYRDNFDECLDDILKTDKRMVLYIADMDDMKLFNQVYYQKRGEYGIRTFAKILRENSPDNATISRYEGKTFCVLFEGTIENGVDIDAKVRKEWAKRVKGLPEERLHFSAGLMLVDRTIAHDSLEAVTLGSLAVTKSKRLGKDRLSIFTQDMITDENLWETGFNVNTTEAISRAIDLKDRFTYNHSANVARYARALAIEIGLSYYEQQLIYEAGLIHDVGKIAIPDRVLTKPGKLTDEEYELMKSHVEKGHNIISASSHGHLLVPLAENHHERWDGRGYPKGIKGEDIPIGGRCLAIADAFDAMTGRRIYKRAMSVEDACAELKRCRGTQFDPELTDVFIRLVQSGKINPDKEAMKVAN